MFSHRTTRSCILCLASSQKSSNFSIESGVKYFVLGSLSTALFLLGVTFIYGLSGSVILTDFKDFFIWVFSANSFFLSFDSIYKPLEIFQEGNYAYAHLTYNNQKIILEGTVQANKFYLSRFDGNHAYSIEGKIISAKNITGTLKIDKIINILQIFFILLDLANH